MNFTSDFLGLLDCDQNVQFGGVLSLHSSELINNNIRTGLMRIFNLILKFYARPIHVLQVITVITITNRGKQSK